MPRAIFMLQSGYAFCIDPLGPYSIVKLNSYIAIVINTAIHALRVIEKLFKQQHKAMYLEETKLA